ncbi:MAG: hypothetical protein QNJ18_02145 [Xenococcaceae cyanobacterium MO_167.B52]|nr:hypothetical protein [Xenococcaceae cyanobacterium MO_167.B52]
MLRDNGAYLNFNLSDLEEIRVAVRCTLNCPNCSSQKTIKYGVDTLKNGTKIQKYKCKDCGKRFNQRTGTPMYRLRHSSETVSLAMKMRSEGNGLRATGRILGKSHATIIGWEKHVEKMEAKWSPPAPEGGDVTLEGDELYTRVKKT